MFIFIAHDKFTGIAVKKLCERCTRGRIRVM